MEGDFGRPKTYTLLGYPLDATYWASDAAHISGPRRYSLTPDEIGMRDAAYRLRIQTHNLTPVKLAYAPESAYAGQLTYEQRTYGPARVTLFDQELRNDHDALTRFGAAARRVLVADRDRMNALLENDAFLSKGGKRHARNRMRSNFAFIEGTFIDLQRRIAAYQVAFDRTRVETPGVSLAAAEGALNHLRDRASALHYELSQAYQVNARHAHSYHPGNGLYPYEKRAHRRIERDVIGPPRRRRETYRDYGPEPQPLTPPFK
jgi:hypothetical protein